MNYQIKPVFLGETTVDRSLYEYRYPVGESLRIAFGCFAVWAGDKIILVDSGIPVQDEIRRLELTFGYMDDPPSLGKQLKEMGINPEAVETIILTHLHWDHCWNLELFPNARIYVQRSELRHAIAPNPHEYAAYTLRKDTNCPGWFRALDQLELLEGDMQIAPGIRAITTPGHTPGSQSVLVDTAAGLYAIVSDFALTKRCYDECVMTGIFTSADDWYASYRKLRVYDPIVLSTHELSTYDQAVYG